MLTHRVTLAEGRSHAGALDRLGQVEVTIGLSLTLLPAPIVSQGFVPLIFITYIPQRMLEGGRWLRPQPFS